MIIFGLIRKLFLSSNKITNFQSNQNSLFKIFEYPKLMGKIEEYEQKIYLILNNNILNKVFDKIEEITDIKKLPNDITLKNVMIFIK